VIPARFSVGNCRCQSQIGQADAGLPGVAQTSHNLKADLENEKGKVKLEDPVSQGTFAI
jgi:hypothetical protein